MAFNITPLQMRLMAAHAEEEYPRECVGVLIGHWDRPDENVLSRLTNVQDRFHRDNPGVFTRDARTGYFVDPKEVYGLSERLKKEGKNILAFYHSHPDHESYFSAEDHSAAVMWGEPVYPGAVYVVISVFAGKVKEAKVFEWDGKTYSASASLEMG